MSVVSAAAAAVDAAAVAVEAVDVLLELDPHAVKPTHMTPASKADTNFFISFFPPVLCNASTF
jgi:hypothetical protein